VGLLSTGKYFVGLVLLKASSTDKILYVHERGINISAEIGQALNAGGEHALNK
jgi:hypothetical protein